MKHIDKNSNFPCALWPVAVVEALCKLTKN